MNCIPDKSILEIAQISIPIVGFLGVVVAGGAILANRHSQREINSAKSYLDYLRVALENPDLAYPGAIAEFDYDKQIIGDDRLEFQRYEWFVSFTLASTRLMFQTAKKGTHWHNIAVRQISYHWRYLEKYGNTKHFLKRWYSEQKKIMDEAIKLGKLEGS
jgi:hypothetical protein